MSEARPASQPSHPVANDAVLAQLRDANATIEQLQHFLRGQESMAHELSTATQELARATLELESPRQPASRWTSLRRRLGRARARVFRNVHEVDTPTATWADVWSERSMFLMDDRYRQWVERYDSVSESIRQSLTSRLQALVDPPLVSIIFPVYNTSEGFLRQAIESVRSQIYTNWELCIADDCSSFEYVETVLAEYAAADARIKVKRRDSNGHISASSNTAIAMADGTWICLMDHDDVLAEHTLAVSVLSIADHDDTGILYSDEDHIDPDGQRSAPYFKPDFDPLLILGQNYFSHLCMIRKDLVDAVGGFREGYEGSQDWDLVLRVIEKLRPSQILHVPHVLYHWRAHSESTASNLSAKPYVVEASRRVVQEYLDRTGIGAQVSTIWGSSFNRVRWRPADEPPLVSVIVLPRKGARLRRCIESIRAVSTYPDMEILVLDDGGFRPPMRQFLRDRADWLTVIEDDRDLSDSAQRNLVAKSANGSVLVFVHDDVEVLDSGWLEEMIGILAFPDVGCVGAKLLYPDMRIQHAGITVGIGGTVGHSHRLLFDRLDAGYSGRLKLAQCPSAVSWACMAVRREAFEAVGGFSESHLTGMFGDVDFCLRLSEAGWRTGWTPCAELIHYELPEDSRPDGENAIRFDRDIRYLNQRWSHWVENDPAYNPNLSLAHEVFLLAWPPRVRFV